MNTTRLTGRIDYIQPDETPFASTSSGLFIKSDPSIVIDINLGRKDVDKFLADNNPDIALISHYHLDHSLWGPAAENHPGILRKNRAVILVISYKSGLFYRKYMRSL